MDAFAADLFGLLAADRGNNIVFSPASISTALRMAMYGARGQTAAELASALHLTGPGAEAAADNTDPLAELLASAPASAPAGDQAPVFRAPNTVWVQSGLPLRQEFVSRLHEDAAATLADTDFAGAPDHARTRINDTIAGQTGQKITGLLPPGSIGALTRLVLASAVYLKAAWVHPFPRNATRDAPFYPGGRAGPGQDRPGVTVPMMRGSERRGYLRGDGYQAVLLPYRASTLAMAIVLPDGPLASLTPELAAGGLGALLAGATPAQVRLALPRFKITGSFGLIPVLRRLGVELAFGDEADFTGITGAEPLRIGAVEHKAYLDVDEHGTEAAAATAAAIAGMAAFRAQQPVTMTVDRPFLFAILHTPTATPLFLGQVSNPSTT